MARSNADNDQIVMTTSHKWVIFKELHENESMAHLGADRVYHVAKDRA